MSEYQRFVSYIYAYSEEGKGRNVGFAKVEARKEQKRIGISLKGIYGTQTLAVYGFYRKQEHLIPIFLSNMYMSGGNGQFQYGLLRDPIPESGCRFDELAGLVIRPPSEMQNAYATIWDDEEFSLSMFRKEEMKPVEENMEEKSEVSVPEGEEEPKPEIETQESEKEIPEVMETELKPGAAEESDAETNLDIEPKSDLKMEWHQEEAFEEEPKTAEDPDGNPDINAVFQEQVEEPLSSSQACGVPNESWEKLKKEYPKARAFPHENPVECIKVKPGSIGKLSRQNWIFANNGFVLYGYMKYHYLVLLRMEQENPVYMLGVPGVSYSKEQSVAELFGFEQFYPVCSGYGYWCVPLEWE